MKSFHRQAFFVPQTLQAACALFFMCIQGVLRCKPLTGRRISLYGDNIPYIFDNIPYILSL